MLTRKLSINTGVRLEIGETDMTGKTTYYSDQELPNTIEHHFPLFAISTQYDLTKDINFYAGWSQAYRPVLFKDIVPGSLYEETDKNLKDAYGYNTEGGFRGKWKFLKWDFTGFYLQYNNRMGNLAQTDSDGNLIVYKTNIGDSRSTGLDMFLQTDFIVGKKTTLSAFTSTSYINAKYQNAVIKSGTENVSVDGNKVESTPAWISRNGFTINYSLLSISALCSYTAESFADALNTNEPNASGSVGIVPSYTILT